MSHTVFSDTYCTLGEGPLWHPDQQALFWFDILSHKLYRRGDHGETVWTFDRPVSAAGIIDKDRLLVASSRNLFIFDTATGEETHVLPLEADNSVTRSNDGRADPWGGFWIGTMGFNAEDGAGAIYRYFEGKLTLLFDNITISNAICFAHDKSCAYFTDSPTYVVMKVALDENGWPVGEPEPFLDLNEAGTKPDGAVIDADGQFWSAQWGSSRVACYSPEGQFVTAFGLPAAQTSCPAFGGPDYSTLFVTSAGVDTGDDDPMAGSTFAIETSFRGMPEYRVLID